MHPSNARSPHSKRGPDALRPCGPAHAAQLLRGFWECSLGIRSAFQEKTAGETEGPARLWV